MTIPATSLSKVDHTALRVNQACIIALLILAFIFNVPLLVAVVGAVMAIGTAVGLPGFMPVYRRVILPARLARPDVLADNPEPHRFSQGLGAAFLLLAALSFALNAAGIGWALSWLVTALAAVNLFGGFCVGCFMYYWLERVKVPGFSKAPPPGVTPGMRPREKAGHA